MKTRRQVEVLDSVPTRAPILLVPLLLLQSACATMSPLCTPADQSERPLEIELPARGEAPGVSTRLSVGTNVLFWIDGDQAWQQDGLGERLGRLGVSTLRYPGGEAADNFDWEHNVVERPHHYPLEASGSKERSRRLDYREFLRHAQQLGVEDVFFVVNVEGAYMAAGDPRENVIRYAQKAAAWVAEVKRLGYGGRHWEIGNEADYEASFYPLTASEYSEALAVFSREMKRADPDIRIGAHGPSAWEESGFADTMTAQQRRMFRKDRAACGGAVGIDCLRLLRQKSPGSGEQPPWWGVVLSKAAGSFDFAVVHRYAWADLPAADEVLFPATEELAGLRDRLAEAKGQDVELAMTEWNVPLGAAERGNPTKSALHNLTNLGNYFAAGTRYAHLWPIRFEHNDHRALLTFEQGRPTPTYRAMRLAAPVLSGRFVRQRMLSTSVYMLHTRIDDAERVMLVNLGYRAERVSIGGSRVRVRQLSGEGLTDQETCEWNRSPGLTVRLPANSVTIVELKHGGPGK